MGAIVPFKIPGEPMWQLQPRCGAAPTAFEDRTLSVTWTDQIYVAHRTALCIFGSKMQFESELIKES